MTRTDVYQREPSVCLVLLPRFFHRHMQKFMSTETCAHAHTLIHNVPIPERVHTCSNKEFMLLPAAPEERMRLLNLTNSSVAGAL